ncbi:uncharacterized protein LOC121246046 [Juglans microcarpa x Juglans regia]|uniref:uncharacterized protein LOC121246046 n=1 Tax=Juglans microcarpa x Juglans regia TaxID=2249226 RepID=UPI001B7E0545|nr:uncharacterized protein LOC121246046 [Juglans microcarpa x Juglans regia]
MIGELRIRRALLDLGSSVNLLPFLVYEQLGLGELKKTSIKIQLADRSVKVPRGIVENVLVQIPGDCDESEVHAVDVISELDEIKGEVYDKSRLAKERMKVLHDKKIHYKHLVLDPPQFKTASFS